jgi:hypothetical protein
MMGFLKYPLVAGLAFIVSESTTFAQARVPVRPVPKPGKVIHITTQQEILVRTGQAPEEPGPAAMQNKNLLAYTQTNGTFNAEGQLQAQVTIERLDLDESAGGRPRPVLDTSSLKGRVVVVTLDRTGKLFGIKVPTDINNALSLSLTQLLAGSYGMLNFVPGEELAVGQDTISNTELPFRLPGNASQNPLQARTTLTLRSIEKKGPDRIAHLKLDTDVATATSQVKVAGGGSMDINLDEGFVSGTDIEWKISATMPANAAGQQSLPFFGSIKISVSAN